MARDPKQQELLALIETNRGIIFKVCNAYCKNEHDREDLAQEIVYQLLRSLPRFTPEFKFSTWMYRVALNVAISFYRKKRSGSYLVPLEETTVDIEDKTAGTDELEKNISMLQRFIGELKELDRALMILYLEEKSYKEISEILGITETNVATKISRIKDKLKQQFSSVNN